MEGELDGLCPSESLANNGVEPSLANETFFYFEIRIFIVLRAPNAKER